MQGGIHGGLGALAGRRALESRGVRQCRSTVHRLFTIHILFYPFTNPQRIGTIVDNGVPHFLENGPRMLWREHTMSSSPDPKQAHRPRQALLCWPLSVGAFPTLLHFGPQTRGIGGRVGVVQFSLFICLYFEIVLQGPLRRPALPEPPPPPSMEFIC